MRARQSIVRLGVVGLACMSAAEVGAVELCSPRERGGARQLVELPTVFSLSADVERASGYPGAAAGSECSNGLCESGTACFQGSALAGQQVIWGAGVVVDEVSVDCSLYEPVALRWWFAPQLICKVHSFRVQDETPIRAP